MKNARSDFFIGGSGDKHQNLVGDIKWCLKRVTESHCLKITKRVAFNIASEASYVYILRGQKFTKNAKNGQFGEFLKT